MDTLTNSIMHALDASATEAPEWLQLLPNREFTGADGRGPYAKPDMPALIARFNADGHRLPVDENHSTDIAAPKGQPSPARGWITELQAREDGLYGRVEWTPTGKASVEGKEYGFISPAFAHTRAKPYRIAMMQRVALTNDPNMKFLKSLHSRETPMLEELRKALGLPETADEAAVLSAVTAAHAVQTAHVATMARIAEAAGAAKDAAPDAIVTAIQARAAPAGAAKENETLRVELTSLQSRFSELVTNTSRDKAVSVIEAAMKAGKLVPGLKDHMIARHMKDPASVEKEIELMVSINGGGLGGRQPPKDGNASMSDEDNAVLAQMGLDPKAFGDTAKALHGRGA